MKKRKKTREGWTKYTYADAKKAQLCVTEEDWKEYFGDKKYITLLDFALNESIYNFEKRFVLTRGLITLHGFELDIARLLYLTVRGGWSDALANTDHEFETIAYCIEFGLEA